MNAKQRCPDSDDRPTQTHSSSTLPIIRPRLGRNGFCNNSFITSISCNCLAFVPIIVSERDQWVPLVEGWSPLMSDELCSQSAELQSITFTPLIQQNPQIICMTTIILSLWWHLCSVCKGITFLSFPHNSTLFDRHWIWHVCGSAVTVQEPQLAALYKG